MIFFIIFRKYVSFLRKEFLESGLLRNNIS